MQQNHHHSQAAATPAKSQSSLAEQAKALSAATSDFLALRAESLGARGAAGRLAELVIHPHLVRGITDSALPGWAAEGNGRLLYGNSLIANVVLGFVQPSRREDPPAHYGQTRDRILSLHNYAAANQSPEVSAALMKELELNPKARQNADYYRSVLSHGDRPTTPLKETDWNALIGDTLKAAHATKLFIDSGLAGIIRRVERLEAQDSRIRPFAETLRLLGGDLPDSPSAFLVKCERLASDERLIAQLEYWSAAEQARAERGGSSEALFKRFLRSFGQAMDRLDLARNKAVESLVGLEIKGA